METNNFDRNLYNQVLFGYKEKYLREAEALKILKAFLEQVKICMNDHVSNIYKKMKTNRNSWEKQTTTW